MFIHQGGFTFSDLDLDKDGKLDDEEIASGPGDLLATMQTALGKPPPYTVEEADEYLAALDPRPKISLPFNFMLRGEHDVVTISDPADSFKKAKAALFSYSRNSRSFC